MALEEDSESFYSVLGIRKDSSAAEIRRAYRKLAKKWHPDKWSKNPTLAEQAKLKFQKIQEAYSVLSDDSKRAMYDAGLYESCEDEDGLSDFLDEMASMMVTARAERSGEDTFEDLQQMFVKMVNENWFSTDSFQSSEPPSKQQELSHVQKPLWPDCELFTEEVENETWDDYSWPGYDLNIEDNICFDIEDHHVAEGQQDAEEYGRRKKPRICDCDLCKQGVGMGFGGGYPINFCSAY